MKNRIRTRLAAALAAAAGVVVLAVTPAHAATEITAQLEIGFNTGVPAARTITLDVHVPMNEYDANGYLIHGAKIQVRFYGSDPGTDQFLHGPITWYRGDHGLTAGPDGIRLQYTWEVPPGSFLNEDNGWANNGDEVYITAKFIDGDGGTISDDSNIEEGFF
ncbi:hypothetical protein GCM10010156_37640 [Planobispora rosea]|uniref:Uncharacterized protein n=1 Tax=Planobispora rosea TaxID=35762 RepID=A0A8J3RV80_PLARO|nr:hypothetical protein [Planobispora rosea]GGS75290.1 hypothetical protein GCM10010156_37640 [Planobispora rosea]GIH81839.1 hypothetical protein Pro02_02470 [Planobispora rosea]